MEQAQTIAEEQELLAEEFELFDDVRDKIEYVIDLGKKLPPLDDAHKIEPNKVHGCQSQVWLIADHDPSRNVVHFQADSDAIIVRGLIGIVMRLYSDRPPEEILQNPPTVFETIGLGRMLTPGRANGLASMVKRVRDLAAQHAKTVQVGA
ncbi:SufE family protein [Marinivivus vitaminiproducens]|uniref:SufE family protein n=1 Tax=Marinivivus vitaminiproducens TaxID=3035935 RepID=UPI0027AB1B26|nr:SufE family protein [Geminicoccaceae bacterium SCSIO 64248]